MQLTNLGKNRTLVTQSVYNEDWNFHTDLDVYFTYSTPTVVVDWANKTVFEVEKTSLPPEHQTNFTSRTIKEIKRLSNKFDGDQIIPQWQHYKVPLRILNQKSAGPVGESA